ncbi:MAG: sigma-70 family RNA polymerase sigma factor [Candidatus Kapabacteria bacterium]|nr:sigma-70 family RNA polymerase sigma factor [Ignavibacteriota bacterium]MCW5884178.1 sigma-70 family RNA polymerase sigma factor [Candidatus Kapabacteria bacterium]
MNTKFEELYETCKIPLRRFAFSIANSRNQAEDIISDTIYYAYINIESLKNEDAFMSYLFTIASRVKNKIIRDNLKFNRDISPDEMISDALSAEEILDIKFLRAAINKLNPNQKEAIILSSFSGLSNKEIAKVQNTTIYNVKIRLYRAKKNLKNLLSDMRQLS